MTATVRVDAVLLADPMPEPLAELYLEQPAAGGTWSGPSLEVSGRIRGAAGPALCVEVLHGRRVVRRIPVEPVRPERAAVPRDDDAFDSGRFAAVVTTLGLPEDLRLELVVGFAGGTRIPVGRIEARREPLRPAFEPVLRPLIVTTLDGLAPPTVLGLLAAHPRIVTLQQHPYECATTRYWLRALERIAQPPLEAAEADELRQVAREPRPGAGLFVERMAELCLRNVDDWYRELARHQVKERARFFAERFEPGSLLDAAHELYPDAKEVFVVRDLRDWASAALPAAGGRAPVADEGEPAEALVRRHAARAAELASDWQSRRDSAHLVRYEDLAADPARAVSGVLDHLELDARPAAVETLLAAWRLESRGQRPHRPGSRAPLGRWRRLAPELRGLLAEAFAAPLRAFGYATERRADAAAASPVAQAAARVEER